jgi:hypothetical protein
MGYTNLKEVDPKTQSRLLDSLRELLDEFNCRNLEIWSENLLVSAHFHAMPDEETALHCFDEDHNLLSMRFPAILDLEGERSRIRPYFSLEKNRDGNVSTVNNLIIFYKIPFYVKDTRSFNIGNNDRCISTASFIKFICI